MNLKEFLEVITTAVGMRDEILKREKEGWEWIWPPQVHVGRCCPDGHVTLNFVKNVKEQGN